MTRNVCSVTCLTQAIVLGMNKGVFPLIKLKSVAHISGHNIVQFAPWILFLTHVSVILSLVWIGQWSD